MAHAEEDADSERRNEEVSHSVPSESLREWMREPGWLEHALFDRPISLHLPGRHLEEFQQVLVRTFPPMCLVCVVCVYLCVVAANRGPA